MSLGTAYFLIAIILFFAPVWSITFYKEIGTFEEMGEDEVLGFIFACLCWPAVIVFIAGALLFSKETLNKIHGEK